MNVYLRKIKNKKNIRNGFTLIEVLVVIGIIAILAAVVLVAINPGRQFAQARNSQRVSNVNAILNAVSQNAADHKGLFTCTTGAIPTTPTLIQTSTGGYDIRMCIIPDYMSEIPIDPQSGTLTNATSYATGYKISQDATTKRITVSSPDAELTETISVTR